MDLLERYKWAREHSSTNEEYLNLLESLSRTHRDAHSSMLPEDRNYAWEGPDYEATGTCDNCEAEDVVLFEMKRRHEYWCSVCASAWKGRE
jgi:hypothetical protein